MDQETRELYTVRMLGLKLPTDPRWVNLAEMDLAEILTDHAYCEPKAATACISLIQAFPDRVELVEELAPIVTEEWGHFRMVLAELNHTIRQLKRWMTPERVPTNLLNLPSSSRIRREPLGVVLIIGPWNYPVQLSLIPLVARGRAAGARGG